MKEKQIVRMLDYMTSHKETKNFGNFLRQCASAYQNKYLYNNKEEFKGSAYAFIQLAEKFEEHTPKKKSAEKARQQKIVGNKNRQVKY